MEKILIVDDEPPIIKLLSIRLKRKNYDVSYAENGLECIEKANKFNPDLILMDIKMPECDGIKAFALLKESEKTREIPVIFMTAFPTREYITKVNEMGAKDCISKPFISEDFEERIKQVLAEK